jgi:2-oxoisovalerate dehydrogenase E1 component
MITGYYVQDIAEYGGAFKFSMDFRSKFVKKVINNSIPRAQSFLAGMGLSINGYKAIVDAVCHLCFQLDSTQL